MHRVTVKTSTIFIAKGGRTRVYRSVTEIPQRLRKELEESTNGFNSATILIADRRGRKEILRALQGLPSALRTRLAASMDPAQGDDTGAQGRRGPWLASCGGTGRSCCFPAPSDCCCGRHSTGDKVKLAKR